MIARNEEQFLPGCLESVRGIVDEIVLVDTGSSDRTVEIAKEHGAVVLHETWSDDFAAPRNTSINAATGDWVLVLDADERLVADSVDVLPTLLSAEGVSAYFMVLRNVDGQEKTLGVQMVRLFRRLEGACFEGRIHEQVTPSLQRVGAELGLHLERCELEIEHHGYQEQVVVARRKDSRNEKLFIQALAERPDCIYTLYKYADFLRRLPEREEEVLIALYRALEAYEQLPPSQQARVPFGGEIAAITALELGRRDRFDEAWQIIERVSRQVVPTPNLHYIAAGLALRTGRDLAAIAHYRACMAWAGEILVVPIQDGATSWVALTGIAQAWLQLGEHERAERLLEQSRALRPSYDLTALTSSRLQLIRGDLGAALTELSEFLHEFPDSAAVCQQTAVVLARTGHVQQARAVGARAIELLIQRNLKSEAERMRVELDSLEEISPRQE